LFDDHVRNLVNSLVCREAPAAFQALPPAADGVAPATFPRIDHFVIHMRAKRTLHRAESPCRAAASPSASSARNFASDIPSCASNGAPTRLHAAKVTRYRMIAAAVAGSFCTPRKVV